MVILGFIEFLKNKLFSSNDVTPVQENEENQNSIQYIQENNVIYHADGTEIQKSEIPHLIQMGLESAIEAERTSPNPKYHRTLEEQKLSSQFSLKNFDCLREKEHKMLDFNIKARDTITDIDETISNCQKAIKAFYDLKKFCYKTDGGVIYFQNMWEYCHNSQNPCFCFIEETEKRLQDLTENYDERKRYYQRRQYAINHLKTDLITLISNQENILQKDVYSHFDADLKDNVSRMLYDMDKKGEIKRVKHGSTYQLSIK